MDMDRVFELVGVAIYDAPNGIDGDQLADMLIEDDRISGTTLEECIAQVREVCRMAARAAIDAHKAALAEAGYVIVPREPTDTMMAAALVDPVTEAVDGLIMFARAHGAHLPAKYRGNNIPLKRWYRTMVGAAG